MCAEAYPTSQQVSLNEVSQRRHTARTSPQKGKDIQFVPAACKGGPVIRMIPGYEF